MTVVMEEISYEDFCGLFVELSGLELSAYKHGQTESRIRCYAQRKGAETLAAFYERLATRPHALQQFLDHLTVNVSYFFRDPERFLELRHRVLPALLRSGHELFIWTAGCANGAETYSVKMLLQQLAPAASCHLLGTDIDHTSLARARRGIFNTADIQHVPLALREEYFIAMGKGYQIDARLREGIEFQLHDLLSDPYPAQVDLILCRNVSIYFTQSAQYRIFRAFCQALRPGGYLLIGNTERLNTARVQGFVCVAPHLYQKLGANQDYP